MSKINNMKKEIEDLNVFRKYFRVRQEFSDEIQTIIYLLNMSFKLLLEIIYPIKKERKTFMVGWGWAKNIAHYESYGKIDNKN